MKLADRCAIITGASQGLGFAIAEHYVAAGASVLLCGRSAGPLEESQAKLVPRCRSGQRVLIEQADVAQTEHVDRLFERASSEFGRLDILVNNAGIYGPMGSIEDVDWAEWAEAITINLMGTVYPCRRAMPIMRQQGYGKIINLSGGGATNPLPRITAYAASKAAVVRFTESLALEAANTGIDVNAVAPGALATRLMDQLIEAGAERVGGDFHARMLKIRDEGGTPLEVGAALCVWLGSRESDGISGRLLSAVWDPWETLQDHATELSSSDIYTLRRIVPADRGKSWGSK